MPEFGIWGVPDSVAAVQEWLAGLAARAGVRRRDTQAQAGQSG
jgi:hypothetical protein